MEEISCKVCMHEVEVIEDESFSERYFFCRQCDFIFMDETDIVSPEEEKAKYLLHENTLENQGYVEMFKAFIKKSIDPHRDRIKTALDYGCGPGPVLATLLREQGFKVDIFDPYFAPRKIYENKKYDLITSTEVLEHLVSPMETLKLIKRHLNKEGVLAIMTLFHPGDENEFKKWWYRREPTHISFYSPKTFRYIAESLDMRILTMDDRNICVLGAE